MPQRKRQQIVAEFRDPACRLFLTTNAGSTGLNLQAADTVVNVDLRRDRLIRVSPTHHVRPTTSIATAA